MSNYTDGGTPFEVTPVVNQDIKRTFIEQQSEKLGRHIVHDPRSRNFAAELPRTAAPLKSVQHRRYDPRPEPNQPVGCCTFVAECMLANSKGNRVKGVVFDMDDAIKGYSLATTLDPFQGTYPPNDTGSSGLAAAKAAVQLGIASHYEWFFGLDAILQGLQTKPISFGGYWFADMFKANASNPLVRPTGGIVGGHQWILSGYDAKRKLIVGECWWGKSFGRNGRFLISVEDFRILVDSGGDAHYTYRKNANA